MTKGIILAGSTKGIEREFDATKRLLESMGLEMSVVNYHDVIVMAQDDRDGTYLVRGERLDLPDFLFVLAMGERDDYDFRAVLRMFETLGVSVINTADTIDKVGDKLYSFQLAKQAVPEVRIPKTMLVGGNVSSNDIEDQIGFPLVLKIMNGVQGRGVTLVRDRAELDSILTMLLAAPYGDHVIAQQAIMSSYGKDVRTVVAAGEILHSFVRVNDASFKSNTHQGGRIESFNLPAELEDISLRIAKAVNLKMGSIDYLFGERPGEYWLCEINSTPGMTYFFQAQEAGDTELLKRFMAMPGKVLAADGIKVR